MDNYKFDLLKRGIEGDLRGIDLTQDQAKELHDSITEIIKQSVAIPDSGIIFMPYCPMFTTRTVGGLGIDGNTGSEPEEVDNPDELFTMEDYQKEEQEPPKTEPLPERLIQKWSSTLERGDFGCKGFRPKPKADEEYPF